MLRRLRFTNFRSWPEADLECGRITGLFGTNSSGKTSILQFLLMLKQTREAIDRTIALALDGPYVWLGTMSDILFRHEETRRISGHIRFDLEKDLEIADPSDQSRIICKSREICLEFEIGPAKIGSHGPAPRTEKVCYSVGKAVFTVDWEQDRDPLRASGVNIAFDRRRGRPRASFQRGKFYAFPDDLKSEYINAEFLSDLEVVFEKRCDLLFYLGPLREYPKPDYLWAGSKPVDVGQRGEKAIDAILVATAEGIEQNLKRKGRKKPFQELVAHWLREMGLVREFRIEEIVKGSNRWQARVRTYEGAPEVLLTDVGFGISQVLPVITLLHYVPEGSTVLLEQPEIHLHPLAQANLADVLIHAATHRRVQVIVESHSEHLLLRLQRRIAEERIEAEEVRMYFCDVEEGASRLVPLEVDRYGSIRNWPTHFMGDAFGETAAAERARIKRMRREKEQSVA